MCDIELNHCWKLSVILNQQLDYSSVCVCVCVFNKKTRIVLFNLFGIANLLLQHLAHIFAFPRAISYFIDLIRLQIK